MDDYPSFLAPIDPKKVEAEDDEVRRDEPKDNRDEPVVYTELFSAR